MLAFRPQTLTAISPTLSVEEAAHRLLGTRIKDAKVYANADWSEIKIVDGPSEADLIRLGAARRVLLEALECADLHAYLWQPGRVECLEIPRLYWIQRQWLDFDRPFEGAAEIVGGAAELDGAIPMLSGREVDNWVEAGIRRLNEISAPPPPPPTPKPAKLTKKQQGVAEFVRYAEALENPMFPLAGDGFYTAYRAWCAKRMQPTFGRSGFYEALGRVRSKSAGASANDNHGNG